MLLELNVENFALIDRLHVSLGPGLTVLTGETGAGKSIIVDAINALLGERVSSEVVREGSERASVQGAFDIDGRPEIAEQMSGEGIDQDETLIVSRDISSHSKTQCRVNGRLMSLGSLRELSQLLADVHGQHEHQLLLSAAWQMEFLDGFAGAGMARAKGDFREVWKALQEVSAELAKLSTDSRERERMADLYRFQVDEIDRASLRAGEEEELRAEDIRLANMEKLFLAAQTAQSLLAGDESAPGAVDGIGQALKALGAVSAFDAEVAGQAECLNQSMTLLEEVTDRLRAWRESLDVSPERIDEVQSRLDLISTLKRKYGDSVSEILDCRERVAANLNSLETSDERRLELHTEAEALTGRAKSLADEMSGLRRGFTGALNDRVEGELEHLGMKGARFAAEVHPQEMSPSGQDRVEFLFSANVGESPRALAKIASGGEASRMMLALKTVLSASDPVKTLIFDEIDTGIGGRTATVVGAKLKGLAEGRQVLCVTHLAQIARFADNHLLVEKTETEGRTTVSLRALGGEERVTELARMLGGDEESEAAVQHARELLGAGAVEGK